MEDSCEPENRLALLSQMRRQNKDADPAAYSSGGFSAVLPKVQIQLCDSIPERKNRRVETARRLDAVQSVKTGLHCVFLFARRTAGISEHYEKQWRNPL
mgnify:CR=1 FL=1